MIVSAQDARIVLSTAGSRDEAEEIAESLVEQGLAACVNLIPELTSIYRWQGAIEHSDEVLLIIKTTLARLTDLESALRSLHSYEIPEFLVLAVGQGADDYLAWLTTSTIGEK